MPPQGRLACMLACSFAFFCCVSRGNAQDETAAARGLFHEGMACLDAQDLECAADRLERSHTLRPSPVVAFNLADVQVQRGELVAASELLRSAMRLTDNEELRHAAEEMLGDVLPQLASLTITRDGVGEVFLDDAPIGEPMLGVAFPINPGPHRVELRDGARVDGERIEAAQGASVRVSLRLAPLPPAPSPEEVAAQEAARQEAEATQMQRVRRRRRIIGSVAALVAVAATIAIVVVATREADYPERSPADYVVNPF